MDDDGSGTPGPGQTLGSRQLARELFGDHPSSWGREREGFSSRHAALLFLVAVTAVGGAWEGLYRAPNREEDPPSPTRSSSRLLPLVADIPPYPLPRDDPLPDAVPLPPSRQELEEEVLESRSPNPGLARHNGGGWKGRAAAPEKPIEKPRKLSRPALQKRMEQGYLALHRGRREEAMAAFRQVLEQDPNHIDARRGLSWLTSGNGGTSMDFILGQAGPSVPMTGETLDLR